MLSINENISSFNVAVPGAVLGQPVLHNGILLVPLSGQMNQSSMRTQWGGIEAINASTG